jgi:hypothetical protein
LSHGSEIQDRAVTIYVTIANDSPGPLPRLSANDFLVLDNGRPQDILAVSDGDVPVALSVVLDLSGGMFLEARRLVSAVESLLRSLPVDGRPAMSLIGRSWRPSDEWRSTSQSIIPDLLRLGIRREYRRPLWSECEWAMTSVAFRRSRRVLVVVTDGPGKDDRTGELNNPSDLELEERVDETSERQLFEYVDRENVLVYAIGFEGSKFDEVVQRLAIRSGGRAIVLTRNGDLNVKFKEIADEIRGQYVLKFEPSVSDGSNTPLRSMLSARTCGCVHGPSTWPSSQRSTEF